MVPVAVVGPDAVRHLAQHTGLLVTDLLTRRQRCFAQLRTDQQGV